MARSAKHLAGGLVASLMPLCRYEHCLFVIGHMRCGSTALSNVLCSRPEISGYGEAHIAYRDRAAIGVLALNQLRRRSLKPRARFLFDKLLHSRYDDAVAPRFFDSRAIFVVRTPEQVVPSIRHLFASIGSSEYGDDTAAATYYRDRVRAMAALWPRFPDRRRLAITYDRLVRQPAEQLVRVSTLLALDPPLENVYSPIAASQRRGAGDPIRSGTLMRIAARETAERPARPLAIDDALLADVHDAFHSFLTLTGASLPA